MKLRVIFRIATITSIILLCIGVAVFLYLRMNTIEKSEDFDLYTLVPSGAVTIVETDDMVDLIRHINELNCSKDSNFLYASELFVRLKEHVNAFVGNTPHGLNRYINKMLVSFHEPDNVMNQVFYFRLGTGDHEFVEEFIKKYCAGTFPSKYFDYHGEEIRIYPMPDDDFLACYLTAEFLAVSYQKKLIEEVIDARLFDNSVLVDSVFSKIRNEKKVNAQATVYIRMEPVDIGKRRNDYQATASLGNWTEFNMKMDGDAIYFSGINHDKDSVGTFMSVLRKQSTIEGFPGNILPSTTFFLHRISVSDLHTLYMFTSSQGYARNSHFNHTAASDWALYYFLKDYANHSILSCQFMDPDYANKPYAVLCIPVKNAMRAENEFAGIIKTFPARGMFDLTEDSVIYTSSKKYLLKAIPHSALFTRLTGIADNSACLYTCFYRDNMLMAPNALSIARYITAIEENDTLESASMYEEGIAGLSDSYNFIMMADLERVFEQPENYARLLPNFFFRHNNFFRHFTFSAQFTCIDNVIYPNIVLLYKGKSYE